MEKFLVFETYHDVSATYHDRILHEQYLSFDYIILLMHAESTLKLYTSFWMTPYFPAARLLGLQKYHPGQGAM